MLITKIFVRNNIKNTSTLFIMTLLTPAVLILSKIKVIMKTVMPSEVEAYILNFSIKK